MNERVEVKFKVLNRTNELNTLFPQIYTILDAFQ